MTVLREVLARFGIEADASPLRGLSDELDGMVGKLQRMGAILAAGVAVRALHQFTVEMAGLGDELDKASQRLGISATSLQQWRFAAQLGGVEASQLDDALRTLQQNLDAASHGGAEQARTLRRLGVSARDATGQVRTMDDILPDLAEGFRNNQNPTERAALAMRLFGDSGQRLLPFLVQGRDGVNQLREEFIRLGGGMDQETVAASAALTDEMAKLDLAVFSLKSKLAAVLIPVVTRSTETISRIVSGFQALTRNTRIVENTLLVLGAAAIAFGIKFAIGFAGPIAITAAIAIAIAFLVLLVDDLITLFRGGKSVIGAFIDELFGVGTAAQIVQDLKDAWDGVVLAVRRASFAVRDFFGQTEPGETMPEASGRAENLTADQRFERQARAAAESGRIQGRPGEGFEAARARFLQYRREAIEAGRIEANQEDVEDGLAPRVGFRGGQEGQGGRQAQAARQAARREARIARRGGGGTQNTVDARTTAVVNVPPGTDRAQLERIRRVVGDVMDQRNRSAAAALAEESPGEEG